MLDADVKNGPSRLIGLSLVKVDLELDSASDDDAVDFEYSAEITVPRKIQDELFFFRTAFSVQAKREGTGEQVRAISATYFCAVRCNPDYTPDLTKLASKYAETSVWGAFTSLFGVLTQQMGAVFPNLPPSTVGVKVMVQPEEDDEAIEEPSAD